MKKLLRSVMIAAVALSLALCCVSCGGSSEGTVDFTARTVDGSLLSYSDMDYARCIMINFWDPDSTTCYDNMVVLQDIYNMYGYAGFEVIGVIPVGYSADDMQAAIDRIGITYPIVYYNDELASFNTDADSVAVFLDARGNVLSDKPYTGARSFHEWDLVILKYFK